MWEREREVFEREARLKDREIAHLTDVAATYKSHYEALKESNSQLHRPCNYVMTSPNYTHVRLGNSGAFAV